MSRITIVGGGIIGSSIAYHLGRAGIARDITVIEPDPTYELAATPRAVGGVRRLFGNRENVEMSHYSRAVYTAFDKHVTGGATTYDPGFRVEGYMFHVAGAEAVASLETCAEMQNSVGARVEVLYREALKTRYPSFRFDDVDAAALCAEDGRLDPHAVLMGYRRAAEGIGVSYRKDRVVGLEAERGRITRVKLESGGSLAPELVFNCANCWAPDVCAMVGMQIPVKPLRRQTFNFLTAEPLEPFPAMRFQSGYSIRPERTGYLTGLTRSEEMGKFLWDLDPQVFDDVLWPWLAERSQTFEAVKVHSGWVGHYDMCLLDGNPIIDRWKGVLDNFYVLAGFSGHGLQHAPAIGRAMKELIVDGGYSSIDLSLFSYQRVLDNKPIIDTGPVA
jgi:glycine/D-amino acid oxidase-like deaminating enzyme